MTEPSKPPYGATRAEWEALKRYTPRLTTVVANPNAKLSPQSGIKALDEIRKIPSRYNHRGFATGIRGWQDHQTTASEAESFAREPDYGAALKLGYKTWDEVAMLALDGDSECANTIAALVNQLDRHADILTGVRFPQRRRGNSPRVLLPFVVTGDPERLAAIRKRAFDIQGGRLELLAHGNQFVACGTHKSGVRYEWWADHPMLGLHRVGAPPEFPTLTVDEFEAIWAALVRTFALGDVVRGRHGAECTKPRNAADAIPDDLTEYLWEHGHADGTATNGAITLHCPWEAEHKDGRGSVTSTVYFPPGTGGHPHGNFICKHDHCSHRTVHDLITLFGLDAMACNVDADTVFQDETPPKPTPTTPDGEPLGNVQLSAPLRAMFPHTDKRLASLGLKSLSASDTGKRGQFKNVKINKETNAPEIPAKVFSNIVEALRTPSFCGFCFRFDSFGGFFCIAPLNTNLWRAAKDPGELISVVQIALESKNMRGFTPTGREIARAITIVCHENSFDSLADRINSFVWDGIPRVARFFEHAFGLEPSDYLTAVAWYVFTVLAGRGVDPGTAAQCMLVLIGGQNKGKTKLAELLALAADLRESTSFKEDPKERAMRTCGRNVIQIDEMRGIETQASEEIKSWISAEYDSHRILYTGTTHREYRRFLLVGSSNKQVLFHDETGNRRFLPVKIPTDRALNEKWVRDNLNQLYAEALIAFINNGRRVLWEKAVELANTEMPKFMSLPDQMTYQVCEYLTEPVTLEQSLAPETTTPDRMDTNSLLRFHSLRSVDRTSLLTHFGFYENGFKRVSSNARERSGIPNALALLGIEGSETRNAYGYKYDFADRAEFLSHAIKFGLVHPNNVHNRAWLDGHVFDAGSTIAGMLGVSMPESNTIN